MRLESIAGRLVQPPAFRGDASRFAKEVSSWMRLATDTIWLLDRNLQTVMNGQVELPTVLGNTPQGTNVMMNYKPLYYAASPALVTPAIEILHGFDRPARGWIWFPNSAGLVMDQILSSQLPDPLVPGYPLAQTTASAWTVKGEAGGLIGGWTDNGVQIGDQIKLTRIVAPAGTVAVGGTNLVTVTGVGTTFKTSVKAGWDFRVTTAGTGEWHPILSVQSNLKMTVLMPYLASIAAGAGWEVRAKDSAWKDIVDITTTASEDELVLLDTAPGTEVPINTLGCDYTIRRPANMATMWVRIVSTNPVCGAFGIF